MNLEQEILRNQLFPNEQALKLVEFVGSNEKRFSEILTLFWTDNRRLTQRSALILSQCVKNYPFLLTPFMKEMVAKLQEPNINDTTKRNILRFWQDVALPHDLIGEIYDLCFSFLLSPKEALAIKAFSMTILGKIAQQIPELKPELRYVIDEQMIKFRHSGAIISRGKKILKTLKKSHTNE